MSKIEAVRGTQDILPEESPRWRYLEEAARRIFALYGYGEIRTPLFEKSELFARAVGETTDIVEKEMYTFIDRNGDSLSLRPEGTASVVRAFVEHGMEHRLPWRVFYAGPMFRHERPQKGRYRQFHQIGCELFGLESPEADAEILAMVMRLLEEVGLRESLSLEINSLGCLAPDCRARYRDQLFAYLQGRLGALCIHCQGRLIRTPLRILDCKAEGCREAVAGAPRLAEYRCSGCSSHFERLQTLLQSLNIGFQVNPLLVRGLDYYTRTGFEVTTTALGAQNAVAAGGRYDGLTAAMGGKPTPAIGFAMGLERLALLLDEARVIRNPPRVYVAAVGEAAQERGLLLVESLRQRGVAAELNLQGGSLKSQLKKADRSQSPYTVILGEQEVAAGELLVKTMTGGEQQRLAWAEAVNFLAPLP